MTMAWESAFFQGFRSAMPTNDTSRDNLLESGPGGGSGVKWTAAADEHRLEPHEGGKL